MKPGKEVLGENAKTFVNTELNTEKDYINNRLNMRLIDFLS